MVISKNTSKKKLCIEIFDKNMKSDKYENIINKHLSKYKKQFKSK